MNEKIFEEIALEGERILFIEELKAFKLYKVVLDYEKVDPGFSFSLYSNDSELIFSFVLNDTANKEELQAVKVFYPRTPVCALNNFMLTFNGENPVVTEFCFNGFLKANILGLGKGEINTVKIFFE